MVFSLFLPLFLSPLFSMRKLFSLVYSGEKIPSVTLHTYAIKRFRAGDW